MRWLQISEAMHLHNDRLMIPESIALNHSITQIATAISYHPVSICCPPLSNLLAQNNKWTNEQNQHLRFVHLLSKTVNSMICWAICRANVLGKCVTKWNSLGKWKNTLFYLPSRRLFAGQICWANIEQTLICWANKICSANPLTDLLFAEQIFRKVCWAK